MSTSFDTGLNPFILFANTFCRAVCDMFFTYAVTAVFDSLSYTTDLPQSDKTILSTFADDTAIFTTNSDPTQTSANLQEHVLEINNWTRKWKLKIN
jgi:hypothetical protein